ncbi:MAG: hypothetical protein SFZ03_09425 [Candidatus Melainabacteria bacterium]|nr:hypothetical protein [Candidatus Melainabacteria bacterium]
MGLTEAAAGFGGAGFKFQAILSRFGGNRSAAEEFIRKSSPEPDDLGAGLDVAYANLGGLVTIYGNGSANQPNQPSVLNRQDPNSPQPHQGPRDAWAAAV